MVRTHEYDTLRSKRDFADVIKLTILISIISDYLGRPNLIIKPLLKRGVQRSEPAKEIK